MCTRCGHNKCTAGKPPYDHNRCQYFTACRTPTCGADTHFTHICPIVYGPLPHAGPAPASQPTASGNEAKVKHLHPGSHELSTLPNNLPTEMSYLRSKHFRITSKASLSHEKIMNQDCKRILAKKLCFFYLTQ